MTEVHVPIDGLRDGIVLSIEQVPLDIRKRLLDPPAFSVDVRFPTTNVAEMGDEQFAAFAAEFARRFEEPAELAYRTWLADVRVHVRETESKLSKVGRQEVPWKVKEREMKAIVKALNTVFEKMCESFAATMQRLGQSAYDAAFRASFRAVGEKIPRTRAKIAATCSLEAPVPVVGQRTITVVPRPRASGPSNTVTVRTLPRLRP
jgi:hypothetical protein